MRDGQWGNVTGVILAFQSLSNQLELPRALLACLCLQYVGWAELAGTYASCQSCLV